MPNVGRQGRGNHTQSVVFDKAQDWTKAKSGAWLDEHGYFTDGYDETETAHRWRQVDPDGRKFRYRTKALGSGISLVLGFPGGKSEGAIMDRTIKTGKQFRAAEIRADTIDTDARTVELSFASEEPYRRWYGWEILDHGEKALRLDRLKKGGAVLVDHDHREQVGVVEDVSIREDRVARALVRFGKSARAEQEWQDIRDGIRRNTSVGYRIHEMVLERQEEDEAWYRATDWEPLEISMVAIPADTSVGVGRAGPSAEEFETVVRGLPDTYQGEEQAKRFEWALADPSTDSGTITVNGSQVGKQFDEFAKETLEKIVDATGIEKGQTMPEEIKEDKIDVTGVQEDARKEERGRVASILAMGDKFDAREQAQKAVAEGTSVDAFRAVLLDRWEEKQQTVSHPDPLSLDLSRQEKEQYSILRALAYSFDERADGCLEAEISQTIAKQLGRQNQRNGIYVPTSLDRGPFDLRQFKDRLATRATLETATATAGQELVATDLRTLIEILRDRMMVRRMGATILSGLRDSVALPRQTATSTFAWVAETPGSDVSDSDSTFDQVTLTPKTAQVSTGYSRQLLRQSSIDIENFVRNDLARVNAVGLDNAAINGTGASNQPTGIRNQTDVATVAIGTNGGAPTWVHIVQMETEVAQDNADVGALGYLTNAKVRGKLKQTEKASNTAQFVWSDTSILDGMGEMNGYKAGVSNAIPSNLTKGAGSSLSNVTYGNWNDLLIGEWGVMELITDPYRLKKQGVIEVTSFLMADIAVRHGESFSIIEDAVTT